MNTDLPIWSFKYIILIEWRKFHISSYSPRSFHIREFQRCPKLMPFVCDRPDIANLKGITTSASLGILFILNLCRTTVLTNGEGALLVGGAVDQQNGAFIIFSTHLLSGNVFNGNSFHSLRLVAYIFARKDLTRRRRRLNHFSTAATPCAEQFE